MLTVVLLLVLAGGPLPAELSLNLLVTEGGTNPGEERFELSADGSVVHYAWRLVSQRPAEERWSIGAEGVEKIRKALAGCRFLELADTLNRAQGADAAYTVRLEALEGGRRHAVLAYKLGSPSPPERFLKLVERIRGILTSGGRYPAAHGPS
jgi:hypothetical protein